MEIKDVILSTLKEIEEGIDSDLDTNDKKESQNSNSTVQNKQDIANEMIQESKKQVEVTTDVPTHNISTEEFLSENIKASTTEPTVSASLAKAQTAINKDILEDEKMFLNSVRERILVLFEGLQSPNNRNIEAKVDLIINFLEYQLAVVDERLEKIQKDILSI
jgi:hypothetical protein